MTRITLQRTDIAYALWAVGDPGETAYTSDPAGDLAVTIPSVGSALVFAVTLTARLAAHHPGPEESGAQLAADIMARTSDQWPPAPPGTLPSLVLTFTGVHLDGPEPVSVSDILAGRLPARASGVHWTGTAWNECRLHLTSPAWTVSAQPSDEPAGQVLTGPIYCHSCAAEATEAAMAAARAQQLPPTHPFAGSDSGRQSVGDPGHCEPCARFGHVAVHPELGCGDTGCCRDHRPGDPADAEGIAALAASRQESADA